MSEGDNDLTEDTNLACAWKVSGKLVKFRENASEDTCGLRFLVPRKSTEAYTVPWPRFELGTSRIQAQSLSQLALYQLNTYQPLK